jgi:glycine/D-amino acid oxidase-like deaminating enzyme/nitrite reductase/ring-hydroxylating ferredoxin subunit
MAHHALDTTTLARSLWNATVHLPEFSPLAEDIHVDVCVVGAGITGLSTAYLLTRAGKSVAVLDDGGIASGMTSMTTAHLTCVLDERYQSLEQLHGHEGSRLAAESHMTAINRIETIVNTEALDCSFERLNGYLFLAPGDDLELLERELMAAQRAGIDVSLVDRPPAPAIEPGRCLLFPNQAQFHPLKYLAGLAGAITRDGGRIFTGTHAEEFRGGKVAHVTAGGHVVSADAIVVATNTPVNDRVTIHTKLGAYMTYAIGARVPSGDVVRALAWDTGDPYHYVRMEPGSPGQDDILIVGGEDHRTGQVDDTRDRFDRLEAWARERFPFMRQVEYAWSGQVMQSIDGLAYIGRNPLDDDNVYVAAGDSGTGITHGTIAAILITDLIAERENPWEDLYDPSRQTMRAAGSWVSENARTLSQYADWAMPGDVKSEDEIRPGSGAVMRDGMSPVAVYRDPDGALHRVSAVCVHLGCIVQWNTAVRTWDCPCHGSRFDRYGHVLNGPANSDLPPAR